MISFKQFLYEVAAPPATPGYIATPTVNPLPDSFIVDPRPGQPGSHQQGPPAPIGPTDTSPNPGNGWTWTSPEGYTYTFDPNTGRWNMTGKPPQIRPAARPTTQPAEKPAPRQKAKPTVRSPVTGEPVNPNYRPQR